MYNVSDAYKAACLEPFHTIRLTGTIGSTSFTDANVVDGSFHLSNQCTDTSDIVLGSVFMGQLEATFTGINIAYTNWIGKDITPTLSVKVGENAWESVPLGVFRVMEAKHTAEGVMVTAYDNMRKFDRKIKKAHFKNVEANLHTFVTIICSDCHITFGMTQEEFFELPNSSETTFVFGYTNATKKYSNDIETYRDLLFYVAQTLGCFATIDRNGQLVFRKYKSNVAETISDRQRLSGAQFADYITNYTGIYVTNMKDDTEDYYGYDYELINTEINLCNQELERIETDLVELQRQYDEHEITEEEYLAQKKVLETERKQVNKRLNWLYKARDKAQAGEEGTFMDLGANPFLQDDSSTVRERMRRRVLKALDPISYTPFTCDSVMGAHYDLGDVIYFTGGHAGSDGVFCCVMAFDWTYNAEYQAQGFGVDPSILNIKDRNTKKTKEANTNALNAKEMSSGMGTPINSDGKQDDIYIKYAEKTTYQPIHDIGFDGYVTEDGYPGYTFVRPTDMAKVPERNGFKWDEDAGCYVLSVAGTVYKSIGTVEPDTHFIANGNFGVPAFKIDVPLERAWYKISCDAKWECSDSAGGYSVGFSNWTNTKDCSNSSAANGMPFTGRNEWTHYERTYEFFPDSGWISREDPVYMWLHMWFPFQATIPGKATFECEIKNLIIEKYIDVHEETTDTGKTATTDRYIDKVYVKDEDPQTLQEYWKEISYVAGIDESSHSGLELDYKRYLHLTSEVMRAWLKADPPQAAQTSNRFCVRYTGKPDTALSIAFWGNSGWLNKSIKRDSEGAYTLKSGGTVSSGVVEYCGYTISGLVAGERYYFNFKANFKDGTQFGDDYDKGLGIVLTTAGIISTDDFSGDPHTFDPETGYCSFYRSTAAKFYDFSFVAPASSIHMFVTVGDIVDGQTSSLTLSRFVISRNERDYIRQIYIYDTKYNDWLQYKPWGSDEEGESASLSDLDDVNIGTVTNGQVLKYDSTIGAWVNADEGTGTEVEANPAGTATGELKKIAIDDAIYTIVDDDAVHTNDVGTAAEKDFTTSISSQNTDLPTSGAVKDAIDAAISSAYKPSGSKTVAELVSSLLVAANMGNVYNMSDSGETTSDFVEGAGKTINTGDNVGIVNIGTDANPVYKFDLLSGFIDMSDYYDKDEVDDLLDAKANNTPTFTEASERTNLAGSGETMTTILGKIKKFFSDLKTVAFSGSYNDLTNKPTLATVATSGSYNDLSNKPTIPTVNNGTLTIQKNGTNVQTFSANQSGNATANIECATPSDVEGSKVATGNPLTITDAAGIKVEKIVIEFEPKQAGSGTPSPSNIRPITGYTSLSAYGCGKNLEDIVTNFNNMSVSGNQKDSVGCVAKNSAADSRSTLTCRLYYYNGNTVITSDSVTYSGSDISYTFTIPANTTKLVFGHSGATYNATIELPLNENIKVGGTYTISCHITSNNPSIVNGLVLDHIMIRKATVSDATFEPFKGDNVTVQFGQPLYGGKLTILQDGSADVDVDTGFDVYDGSNDESWTRVQQTSASAFLISGYASNAISYTDRTQKPDIQSNYLSALEESATWGSNNGFITTNINLTDGLFYVGIQSITTVEAWRTYLASNNLQVAYKLKDPFTIHLSPVETLTLLQGINNVWTDGTTLSLTYQPDNAIGEAKGTAQDAMAMVNALASTAVKVIAKKGQYEMGVRDWVDMPDCSLSLDKGTYLIMGWCNLTGDNYHSGSTYYRYGCAIADSSNNRLVGNTFKPDSNQAYEASISTCLLETITTDATVRKLKGYMGYSSNSYPIKGGIVAIKIA